MKEEYRAILEYPHYIHSIRQPMSITSRAAKFAAFKALDGHEDKIVEAGRETSRKHELTDEERDSLNARLYALLEHQYEEMRLYVRYFEPDKKKEGGAYIDYEGTFKYYREDMQCYVFVDGLELTVEKIVDIEVL